VNAAADGRAGRINTDEPQGIVVTVTDQNGAPVTKLKPSAFKLQAFLDTVRPVLIVAGLESPKDATGLQLKGVYYLRVALRGFPWEQAITSFVVTVKRGGDIGMTTLSLDLH